MSDDTAERAIERGLDAYFAGDTVADLLESIDIDALVEGAPLDDAVEYERLGKALGAILGRAAARGVSNTSLFGRIVRESVGSEVGGRVGEVAVSAFVEYTNPQELVEDLQGAVDSEQLDEFTVESDDAAATDESDWTTIDVEYADEE